MSQYDVDFVIPRVGADLPLGIDPFLLYKSRDPAHRELHRTLLAAFNAGIEAVRSGSTREARRRFDFPEVAEIGLGYTKRGKRGSGVGTVLTSLILETLSLSPALLERGVRHVEEMQLLSAGVGPDRVSDIAANVLKRYLIEYTKRQCELWSIPVAHGVPVPHVYDAASGDWEEGYFDLPVSELNGSAILLVPRRIVRVLPWINYEDFVRGEFAAYLSAKRQSFSPVVGDTLRTNSQGVSTAKDDVVRVTRSDIDLVERYVRSREAAADQARPATDYGAGADLDACRQSTALKERLAVMPSGRETAAEYQRLILEVLNFGFSPDLVDGQPEIRTIDGTERRDLIFTNESDETFWQYVRGEHASIFVMFELKNTEELRPDALNQTGTYLGDRLGRLGFIVTRRPATDAIRRKAMSIWNDSSSAHKAIIILSDEDMNALLDIRCHGTSPTRWIQQKYREFRTSLQ